MMNMYMQQFHASFLSPVYLLLDALSNGHFWLVILAVLWLWFFDWFTHVAWDVFILLAEILKKWCLGGVDGCSLHVS